MFQVFIQGLLLQASLILALGAQNIYVLESGLKKKRHLFIAGICSLCDTVLIFLGVAGCASVFLKFPPLKIGFGFLGVGFLFIYGVLKLRESYRPDQLVPSQTKAEVQTDEVLTTTLGFSLLNPHVYLDTLVLIGGYSTQFQSMSSRLFFGLGAAATSWIWFFSLAGLASFGNRFIHNSSIMGKISLLSGLILIALAIKLSLDVFRWMSPL